MPDFYAHQVFGKLVYQALPEDIQARLEPQKAAWRYGLYGPDPLFFYHPLSPNPVAREGHEIHEQLPGIVLERFHHILNHPYELGYSAGFLCHYILDTICHPIVNKAAAGHHLKHTMIEGAFDRSLVAEGDSGFPFKVQKEAAIYEDAAVGYASASGKQLAYAIRSFCLVSTFVAKFRLLTPRRKKWLPTVQKLTDAMYAAVPLCVEQITAYVNAMEQEQPLNFLPGANFQGMEAV